MKPKSEAELIRFAAVEIMGYIWVESLKMYIPHENSSALIDWSPLSDPGAYQLELIEAALPKEIEVRYERQYWDDSIMVKVTIFKHDHSLLSQHHIMNPTTAQIRLCKLTCFVEGFEKYLEVSR